AGAIASASSELAPHISPPPGTVAIKIRDLADCWVATLALQARGYRTVCVASLDVLASLEVRGLLAIVVSADEEGVAEANRLAPVYAMRKPVFDDAVAFDPPPLAEGVEACGHILYTSGTTGKYKKVFLPARTQRAAAQERCRLQGHNRDTRYNALSFGLWTSIGYKMAASVWSIGGIVILDQREGWPEHFVSSGLTRATILPDQALQLSKYSRLTDIASNDDSRPTIAVAGGFLSAKLAEHLSQYFDLKNIYGCTEVNVGVLIQDVEAPLGVSWMTLQGTREVEIENDRHQVSAVNEEGRLRIKLTDLDAQGYLDEPELSSSAFNNGYFYPGDLAVRRNDGKFRILGRAADVVNLAGQKLAVAPIEANLQTILQVDYVCLFAGVNAAGEPEAVIAMEAAELPSKDRLDHVGQEFSQWGEVRFALLESFPRTQSGTSKIDRKRLRELIFAV
ncbi:MAG: acyl--CoA ligase, partial [Haliea sp.]|nr:acyl--CoA ligase [Haliea sp.]